jgi:hypothetical protein
MLTEVLLLRADDLNCKDVPVVTVPVLVTASEGLAKGAIKAMSVKEKLKPRGERTRNTKAATLNERAGNGKNLLGKEGDVKRLGDGRGTRENVQYGLVAGFDGYDGSGGSQDIQVLNEVRGTKVCANADIFYDPSGRQESLGITEDT